MDCLNGYIFWPLAVAITLAFLALSIWTNILRDTIDDPAAFMAKALQTNRFANTPENKIPRPFSLARTVLGVWTVIIACTYLYVLLCPECTTLPIISPTALALLGINAGTAVLAGAIDQGQSQPQNQSQTQTPPAPGTEPRHQNEPSQGFLLDILKDKSGISVHRFQNVAWTVVAITVYLAGISKAVCSLPELDNTLLTLSGISSATYLGLKINENRT